jgi:hypothetical protein
MKNNFGNKTWKPKKVKNDFKPDRKFIKSAVQEFLSTGGKIKKEDPPKITPGDGIYNLFGADNNNYRSKLADD